MKALTWFLALAALATVAFAQEGASETRITETFGIYPLAGSSVNGHLQIEETQDGTAHFVITLNAVDFGEYHAAVLHSGDCGPDRPVVQVLETVGRSLPDDRFVSLTATDLVASDVLAGSYSVMIYGATLGSEPMACGNVGADANRSALAPILRYQCVTAEGDQISFTLRFYEGGIELHLPERFGRRTEVLTQVPATPGVRYASADAEVQLQGEEATLQIAGESYRGCKRTVD